MGHVGLEGTIIAQRLLVEGMCCNQLWAKKQTPHPCPRTAGMQEPPLVSTALFLTLLFFFLHRIGFNGFGECRAIIQAGRTTL